MSDAVVQEVERKNRFTRTRRAADQSAATDWQASLADIIKALNPCWELLNLHLWGTTGAGNLHSGNLMEPS